MLATGAIVAVNGLNPLSLLTLGIGGVLAFLAAVGIAPNFTSKLSSKNDTQHSAPVIEENTNRRPGREIIDSRQTQKSDRHFLRGKHSLPRPR